MYNQPSLFVHRLKTCLLNLLASLGLVLHYLAFCLVCCQGIETIARSESFGTNCIQICTKGKLCCCLAQQHLRYVYAKLYLPVQSGYLIMELFLEIRLCKYNLSSDSRYFMHADSVQIDSHLKMCLLKFEHINICREQMKSRVKKSLYKSDSLFGNPSQYMDTSHVSSTSSL